MKHTIITKLYLLILIISMDSFNLQSGTKPDFNYPKNVSTTAISDLKEAEKTKNYELLCDALIRYSVAQSLISSDNAAECMQQIETYRNMVPSTDYKAIITLLEANIYGNLKHDSKSTEIHDSYPADLADWSASDYDKRIKQLFDDVFANINQLSKYDIKNYASLIKCNALFFPTLLDFAFSQRIDAAMPSDDKDSLMHDWLKHHEGDVAPSIYISTHIVNSSDLPANDKQIKLRALYNRYSQFEESGYILTNISITNYGDDGDDTDGISCKQCDHAMLSGYLKKFPKSQFASHITNMVYEMEAKFVTIRFPETYSSKNRIPIEVTYENVTDYSINIYSLKKTSKDKRIIDKLVRTVTFHVGDTASLSSQESTQYLEPLPYGIYTILPSFVVNGKRHESKDYLREMHITDLSAFTVRNTDGHKEIYAIDRTSGQPEKGVGINPEGKPILGYTDGDGMLKINEKTGNDIFITKGKDIHHPVISTYSFYEKQHTTYPSKIITDLGIYRPGETIKYSAIISQQNGDSTSPLSNEKIIVSFHDASSKEIATDSLTTDKMGRIDGEFKVPTDRMNGSFYIKIHNKKLTNYKRIEVSEYKTPSFYIALSEAHRSYNKAEDVTIKGTAYTFSGMPVANAQVIFTLNESSWTFWNFQEDRTTILQDTIATNSNGEFSLTIPQSLFKENSSHNVNKLIASIYSLNISCTNNTGETQSHNHEFFVGQHRRLHLDGSMTFINRTPISLPVTIESSDPADKDFSCTYKIYKSETDSTIIASGKFTSEKPTVDLTTVPSGTYHITVEDASGLAEKLSTEIILYRDTDKECPTTSVLWVPFCGRKACDNDNKARITIGTSEQDIHLFYLASTKKNVTKGWKHFSKGIHTLELPMPTGDNEEMNVTLFTMKNGKQYAETFTLIAPKRIVKAKIEAISFRDKLSPDAKEKWTFRFIDNHGRRLPGAAILSMTDKAINTIASNIWYNSSLSTSRTPYLEELSTTHYSYDYQHIDWTHSYVSTKNIDATLPTINYYGHSPFDMNRFNGILYESATVSAYGSRRLFKNTMASYSKSVAALDDRDITSDAYDEGDIQNGTISRNLNDIAMRLSDIKTALWLPNISTDENGDFTVEFSAPNFNTTWIMQALAFSANGYFGGIQKEVVTSRPLMVKANMPRFIRVGDKITLAANVANKTDETAEFNGIIELFDPRTDKIIASQSFNGTLQAMCDTAVTIDYSVPQDASFLGFRIKAATNGSGDGEQVMVPIISDQSPVIETYPLYIDAGKSEFTARLPQVSNITKATLEYCDNPVWYCATALPTIFDEDAKTSTSLAHTLFALSVAHGIAKDNVQIADAIKYWQEQDSTNSPLISALSRNSDLKIRPLLASPWISEADRQTLRMSKLSELFDSKVHAEKIRKVVNALKNLQKKDGGFTWFNYTGCESSLYCTGTVLEFIARIRHLGYTVDDPRINKIVSRAIKYYDKEFLDLMKEEKKSAVLTDYADYAYIRTMYSEIATPAENAQYIKRIIKDIKKGWSGASLPTKAFYALTLNSNGEKKAAREITESIRQFSITTPQRGMYWDAIEHNWWRGDNKLSTTTLILQALNEVDHRTEEIDQIRKWILLNKQSNDWGGSSLASEAVYTILATGNQWLVNGEAPEIRLGTSKISFTDIDRYLGYCRKEINPDLASGVNISIKRGQSTSPAWGAVYLQGKAQSTTIKSAKVDDLSIEKSLLIYNTDGTLAKANNLKVGDKVRVQFSIKCGKSLEYLTLTDERGACFEPTDKTSDADYQNGVWMYREVKDYETNIFIGHLSKGSYIIGYDTYVTNQGSFGVGIATIQCQFSPQITAHSAGSSVVVK